MNKKLLIWITTIIGIAFAILIWKKSGKSENDEMEDMSDLE